MKFVKFLLLLSLVVTASVSKAELTTVAVDGLFYAVDPSGSYRYATLVEPVRSTYVGEIKVPNSITYKDNTYTVRYILKTAFTNAPITTLVLPYSFSFVDEPQQGSGSTGGVLGSNGFTIGGGSSSGFTSGLTSDENIERIRDAYHHVFDTCDLLQGIFTWANASTTTETAGDGHIYYDNLYKPYKGNWIDSKLYRWHIYTPKNTNPQVKFTNATSSAREIYFVFSIGNFNDYPTVESIEFPSGLEFNGSRFFNSDVKINCPNLKKYIYNGKESTDGCLYKSSQIFAIPPGITGNFTISSIFRIYSKYTLSHSNITKLTIREASNGSMEIFENFDGDITLESFVPQSSEEEFFTSFSNVKQGHTLCCDPINFEMAKKFWPGEVKANDLYIKSILPGLTSLVIEFGGNPEKLKSITQVKQADGGLYGKDKKLSDSKWVVNKIYKSEIYGLYLAGIEKRIFNHPSMKSAMAKRTEMINQIKGTVSDIKQTSAQILLEIPELNEYDDNLLAITAASLDERWKVKSLSKNLLSIMAKDMSPNSAFNWNVNTSYLFYGDDLNSGTNKEITYSLASGAGYKTKELKVTKFEYQTTQCGVKVTDLKADFDDSWSKDSTKEYYFKPYYDDGIIYKVGDVAYVDPHSGIGLDGEANSMSTGLLFYLYSGNNGKANVYLGNRMVNLKPLLSVPVVTPTTIEIPIVKGDAKIKSKKIYYTATGIDIKDHIYPSVDGLFLHSMPQGPVYLRVEISGERPDGKEFNFRLGSSPTSGSGLRISMPKVVMETKPVKVVNSGQAIVAAETNISDREPNFGFQWKKYNAPETLNPSEAYCGIYDGVAEGYIKNLSTSEYYNARAFYRDAAGNCVYGDWVTFDPSDFSFFEPTAHTYAATEVSHRTASIRGYVLRGTDDILDQGFEYGRASNTESHLPKRHSVASGNTVVSVSGQVMEYTIEDLEADTEYFYRTYVTTKEGTYYGETRYFTTDAAPSGVENIASDKERILIGVFDMTGKRVTERYRGLSIEIYSDGTSRKVFRK